MVRVLSIAFFLLHCGLQVTSLEAQLRGYGQPPAAREPARVGLLGGIREAREERFRREAQAAVAAARGAAGPGAGPAARNPVLNPNLNPLANPNLNAARNGAAANSNLLRRDPVTGAVPPTSLSAAANQRSIEAARAANLSRSANAARTANYGSANLQNPNLNNTAPRNPGYSNVGRASGYVAPASASAFVPSPMGDDRNYDGPGVAIRLPADARGVVNYLVDDVENNAVRPGQQQVLDSKGSYVIRYSRGVTADGRSFGESRYTVTEGRYRFDLTDTGWELYRETEFDGQVVPPNRIEMAESDRAPSRALDGRVGPLMDRSFDGFSAVQRELPTESLATESPEASVLDVARPAEPSRAAKLTEPAEADPAESVTAEELPAPKPRSILEK